MNQASSSPAPSPTVSAWAPFGHAAFALLWTATLVSNIGTWMHDVGAGWLMTTLDPSPATVSLVQTATTLPVFLFALLAGTLADRFDKRTLLITINILLLLVAVGLATLVALQRMSPGLLIAFTFLIGTGAAFLGPAWQSVVPELVPRRHLTPAIALNSMGINISRAIGPALAGFLITGIGLSAPFVLNAASHVVIILALFIWRPAPATARTLPPEPMIAAMLTGLRHAAHNAPLKSTLVRALAFFLFASAYWSLLPLVARGLPGGGAELYGILLGAVGTGAVAGALLLPGVKSTFNSHQLAALGTAVTAFAMAVLATVTLPIAAAGAALLGGFGWIIVLTSLNVSAQTALPNWVRARGLAIYLMVFFGAMAAGSALWGQVANLTSVPAALLAAAIGALAAIAVTWRVRLGQAEEFDLSPSAHWPAPVVDTAVDAVPDRGPVMVTITYMIDPATQADFLQTIYQLGEGRYRDGAYQWGVYQDAGSPQRWIEWFLVPSWAEHLRQHERVSHHDKDIQEVIKQFHITDDTPNVEHWLAPVPASSDPKSEN
ncbi:MFS transporter [Exilibacterium tricleocarpae]|uniref:MFS transporter n=1 Tax=Exilibacterium tricleocarpae TaxID=2591008 RepID=A0A545UBE4_9GAMM|nr:MFS transporter [Exilibacterium tricleocarpae]TQV86791.1 MFS transporter [Exilibacterium tricleocarpae]